MRAEAGEILAGIFFVGQESTLPNKILNREKKKDCGFPACNDGDNLVNRERS